MSRSDGRPFPYRVVFSHSTKHLIKARVGITRRFPLPDPYGKQGMERDDERGDGRLCSLVREKTRSRATNSIQSRAGSLTSCQGRADKPPGQGSKKGPDEGPRPASPPSHTGGKMLRGCFVDIADFPTALGSETTHVAGTTRASRQGRRRKTNAPWAGPSTDIEIGASPKRGQRNPEH
jgi:hypothetical protein